MLRLLIALIVLALFIPTVAAISPRELTPPQPAATSANKLELVGHAGERFSVSFVQGNIAYIGSTIPGLGSRLTILGGTDLARPQRISTLDFQDNLIMAIVVSDGYAYVLTRNQTEVRLHVIAVGNPAAPFRVANIFLASTIGLAGASVSAQTIDAATGLAVQGNYVYAATGAGGLRIVDIANPLAPTPVGSYIAEGQQGNWPVSRVIVADHYAYVRAGFTQLRIVDIANPAAPVELGIYDTQDFRDIVGLVLAGNYVYVATEDVLESVDISNPSAPTLAGSLDTLDTTGIAMLGQRLYLGSQDPEVNLRIVDIANPAAPAQVSTYDPPGCYTVRGVMAFGPYLYVSGDWSAWILDVSDPVAPVLAGSRFTSSTKVVVSGSHAYVSSDASLRIFDIANPAIPTETGAYLPPGTCNVRDVVVVGQYAYVAAQEAGLHVVDISDPVNPAEVAAFALPDTFTATDVAVAGQYAYVVANKSFVSWSLYIVNVANPATPAIVGVYELPSNYKAGTLAVNGSYVYLDVDAILSCCPPLAANDQPQSDVALVGLHILNIAQPAQPVRVGIYKPQTDNVGDLVVAGRYAYVSVTGGLRILDLSAPAAPVEIGAHAVAPASAGALALKDRYVYLTNQLGGIWVVDVSVPTNPTRVNTYKTPVLLTFNDVAVAGDYLFVAAYGDGFYSIGQGWSISGQITHANGMPAAMGGVSLNAGAGLSATTDVSGTYALDRVANGMYTVAPSLAGYTFWPPSRSVSAPPDARGQNFTILPAPVGSTLTPGITATLAYSDSQGLPTRLDLPADAVSQTLRLGLTPLTIADVTSRSFAGHAFELESSEGAWTFGAPVTVTIAYSVADVRVISDTSKLALWRWDGTAWHDAESCSAAANPTHDAEARTLSVPICGTGRYALFGPTHRVYLSIAAHSSS